MVTEQSFSIKCGQDIAKYLVYFAKLKNHRVTKEINIVNISGTTLYRKHKRALDKLYKVQEKYQIDLVRYIKFFLEKYNYTDDNIDKIAEVRNLMWYAEELSIRSKHDKVYGYVLKSVKNAVDDCIKLGFQSTRSYLRYLIENNMLAEKYLSGELSQYYIAGIRNLKKIVWKMDRMNQETLKEIVDNQDKIISDTQDAFVSLKNIRISIIKFTDDKLLEQLRFRKN